MKYLFTVFTFLLFFLPLTAQKYITKTGYIGFYSHTPVEDIKAENNQVASIFDISTGDLVSMALIKSFHFPKALMEEHFNEDYLESDKYPRSTFTGKIMNYSPIDPDIDGKKEVTVEGDLNIHNITRKISVKGTIETSGGKISALSKFNIIPDDYNISIPNLTKDHIAKSIEVTINIKYDGPQNK